MAPGEGRVLEQNEGIEGVAVLGEGVGEEPVLRGVHSRGEQVPIQPDLTGVVVDLVLVARPLGDLDDDLVAVLGIAVFAHRSDTTGSPRRHCAGIRTSGITTSGIRTRRM